MNSDKAVMKYFPKQLWFLETKKFYETIQNHFFNKGYGLYVVELKATKKFIGFVGFQNVTFNSDFTPCMEIGWRFSQENWGKGLTTEAAKACLNYAKNHLHFHEVYSFTSVLNYKSEKIMKKIGMKKVKDFFHPNIDKTSKLSKHVLYKIKLH